MNHKYTIPAALIGVSIAVVQTQTARAICTGLTQNRTKVGVIHELLLGNNQGFSYILRKS